MGKLRGSQYSLLLGVIACVVLAYNAIHHSVKISATDESLFITHNSIKFNALQGRADEMRNRLSFMVFADERKSILEELRALLKKQLNLQPYNGRLWVDLLYTQDSLGLPDEHTEFAFHSAHQLLRWHVEQQLYLARRCVMRHAELSAGSRAICADLLANLPNKNKPGWIAHKMQLSVEDLREIAQKYAVRLGNGG